MASDPKASRTTPEDGASGSETTPARSADPKSDERAERAARAKERSTSTERVRRYRERKKAQETSETPETTESDVVECAAVFSLIYDLALVPVTGNRLSALSPEQSERAGRVLAPLVKKYAPMLGEFQTEIAAALVIGSILRSNWREPPVEVEHETVEE